MLVSKKDKKMKKIILIVGVVAVAITLIVLAYFLIIESSTPWGWSEDMDLTPNMKYSQSPDIAVDSENNLYVVWMEGRFLGTGSKGKLYYLKIETNGNIRFNNTPLIENITSYDSSIALDSQDNMHLVVVTTEGLNYLKIDKNRYIITKKLISQNGTVYDKSVAIDGSDRAYVVWANTYEEVDETNFHIWSTDIYFTKIDVDGTFLIKDKHIDYILSTISPPIIKMDSENNIHLAWAKGEGNDTGVYYKKIDWEGDTLINNTRISDPNFPDCYKPAITRDSNDNIYITWKVDNRLSGEDEVYYRKLNDNGEALINPVKLSPSGVGGAIYGPDMAIDSNDQIHVIYARWSQTGYGLYYVSFDSNGNILVNNLELSSAEESSDPVIAVDSNNNIHVVWRRGTERGLFDPSIYYKHSGIEDWFQVVLTYILLPMAAIVVIILTAYMWNKQRSKPV